MPHSTKLQPVPASPSYTAPPSVLETATRLARQARKDEEDAQAAEELERGTAILLVTEAIEACGVNGVLTLLDVTQVYGQRTVRRWIRNVGIGMGVDVCR